MISIDTNILVRFLTHDDENQFQKSLTLIKDNNVYITDTVILETEWVLRYAYNFDSISISAAFTKLFGLPNIQLSNPANIAQAIDWHNQGLDFADALHLSQCQQNKQFFTFDKQFIKKAKGLGKCSVLKP